MRFRHAILAAVMTGLAAGALYGCQTRPDIEGQRDIGYNRPERSGEVMAERTGAPSNEDTTTAQSVKERSAADAVATGKQVTQASQ